MTLEVAAAKPDDVPELGRICYEAFKDVHDRHGFPNDFPNVGLAQMVLGGLAEREDCYFVAAREDGRLVGSNGLLMADEAGGVGPVSVDIADQGKGIGRALMQDVLKQADRSGIEMVRLMQDSFNVGSLSLYASLGFHTRGPVAVIQPAPVPCDDGSVRPITEADLSAVEDLSLPGLPRVGHSRRDFSRCRTQSAPRVPQFVRYVSSFSAKAKAPVP